MTNAIDILCVGGAQHGQMWWAHLSHGVKTIEDGYVIQEWRDPDTNEGYWIAANPSSPVDDPTIKATIAERQFTPAWNLRT